MKVLLIDVDSKIPNIALMKLSGYYKSKGDSVELRKLNYNGFPKKKKITTIDALEYDKVFVSIIFTCNKDVLNVNAKDITFGGTGWDLTTKLPPEIDDFEEDYSIYPENTSSYGFLTRGCIRNCPFCFVPRKEGMIKRYRDVSQVVKHKKVYFLDNNIFAHPDCDKILQELVDKKIRCQFNQGLDIRLLTETKAQLLSKLNYFGDYIFAFDDLRDKSLIDANLILLKKYIKKDWKIKFFIYCNANMPIIQVTDRITWCKNNKCLPYLMRDKNCWEDNNVYFYNNLGAYCNQPGLFKNLTWKQFLNKRTKNKNTIEDCLRLW